MTPERARAPGEPLDLAAVVAGSPRAALALQRTAGNAAVARLLSGGAARRRTLQRAILAVHGKDDDAADRKATEVCVSALATRKTRGRVLSADAPRGRVWVLDFAKTAKRERPPKDFLRGDHALYVVAHGGAERDGRWFRTAGGFDSDTLASLLVDCFGSAEFTGKIKLVVCQSAADRMALGRGRTVSVEPFALQLAEALEPDADDLSPFRPESVQGVIGMAWVDDQGRLISIDPAAYESALATDPAKVEATFGTPDPVARQAAIAELFPTTAITVGKAGKRRKRLTYPTSTPRGEPSTG